MDIMTVTDARGRVLEVRSLGPSALLDLLEAAEANSTNSGWLGLAMRVCSVVSIDSVPVLTPDSVAMVKKLADDLGFDGLAAVDKALTPAKADAADVAKN